MGQLFQNNQQIKKCDKLKTEFDLIENEKYFIGGITHAFPCFRSSRSEVFCSKGVFKNFAKFAGIQLCQSLSF